MKIWRWFCQLGTAPAKQKHLKQIQRQKKTSPSGTEICTRVCGQNTCRCGGTMRGLYCIWSYYRE